MPFNGSGTFNLIYNWQNDAAQGINISSSRMMGQENDIASALSDCLTRDGQSPPTHDLPMGGFHLTNMANASAQGNAVTVMDVQNGSVNTLTTVAGTDTITATTAPAITAYAAGQAFDFIPAGNNLLSAPTLNLNGLGAKNLTKNGVTPLSIGDLQANVCYRIRYDGTQFQVMSPIASVSGQSFRNKLINGRFDVWQRGGSFNAPATGAYCADRWIATAGTAGVATVTIQSVPPGNAFTQGRNFLQFAQSTGSAGPNLSQRIESVITSAGMVVTLTVVGNVAAGTLVVSPSLIQVFGTGGSPSTNVITNLPTFTLTTSQAAYSVSVLVPSLAGKTIGTNRDDSLQLSLNFPINTTFTASLTNIQLEEGAPTPFENRPLEVETALCQRYTWAMNETIGGVTNGASSGAAYVKFPVTMRAAPTYTNIGNGTLTDGVSFITMSGLGLLSATAGAGNMSISTASATTAGRGCTITGQTGLFSSEL